MGYILLTLCVAVIFTIRFAEGANCDNYTGAVVRQFNTDNVIGSALSNNEHQPTTDTGLEVVLDPSDYSNNCACGIVTMWQFYAWHPGTVVFYVLDGTRVVGTSSFYIGVQSQFNFFEVPLSSDMWIPIRSGYKLGFFTEGEPMITYQSTGSFVSGWYNTGQTLKSVGGNVLGSGTQTTGRKYAVAAYIIEAHSPMFVNAPFETTLYTHEVGTIVYTASALDLDGFDTPTFTKTSGNASFDFDDTVGTLLYAAPLNEGQYIVTLEVSDGCNAAVPTTITINLVNEGPSFENMPASVNVDETQSPTVPLHTMTATDPSGDTLTCSLDSTIPSGVTVFSLNYVLNGVYTIQQTGAVDYSSAKYYDLRISCQDTDSNTIYTNFQVNIEKNQPPFFNAGDGFLPASKTVDRTSGVSIYQLDFSDPEGDTVTVVTGSTACSGGGACPFSVSSTGEVTTNDILGLAGYDLQITIQDNSNTGNTVQAILSIITADGPYTFNNRPVFINLPRTIYVMEHTPVDTYLLKVLYVDKNPTDTFTLALGPGTDTEAGTYFQFDTSTGIISVKSDINFETTGAGGWTMEVTVNDGPEVQHATRTGTVTFTIVNINEGITLTIGNTPLIADETNLRGTEFSPGPSIAYNDIDSDTPYYTMDCGEDSKYFYLDTATLQVHFAREYDMDSGLSGFATCTVTVRDRKGLSDSSNFNLTINNINDNDPKFPKHNYVFFVSTSTTFFTEIANMAASDADSDSFGSTAGTLLYNFDPVNPTEDYFQIDVAGVLYVRNLTTYTASKYDFKVIATDSGGRTGTCTVTVIFSGVATTTTTTTERSLVFKDDYQNYFWLLLLGGGIFATIVVIGLMIYKDPVVNEFITFKMFKLDQWCRKRPKPKEPKRTVGKLRVTINKKDLENDPDNALPWELLAKDNEIPEINEVQEMIEHRMERRDRDYKNFSGLPVFERGKGERPESGRATVHSSASSQGRPESDSPKYATFMPPDDKEAANGGGEGQWGDLTEQRVIITPVAPAPGAERNDNTEIGQRRAESPEW